LIRDIIVDVDAQAGEAILVIHWKGGIHTELRLPRRRRGQNSTQTSGACQGSCRFRHAASAGLFDDVMAESRSGSSVTAAMGDQLRVWRDQRAGLRTRAAV
jgi:hypothetical protein